MLYPSTVTAVTACELICVSTREMQYIPTIWYLGTSVTRKKLPSFYKSCLKMISLEKLKILTPLQKLPKNVGDLGK